jgi:hypothetical protein
LIVDRPNGLARPGYRRPTLKGGDMKDKIYCSGGQRIATMSFGINRPPAAYHVGGTLLALCKHQIWIGKQIVYNGKVIYGDRT